MTDRPNYITPSGFHAMQARYRHLLGEERPRLVEVVSWAAGNGDRSENGDYIYGRKRLREIDRELGWLARRMKSARIVDPAQQTERHRVLFGAAVTIADEDDARRTLTLVGEDETDTAAGRVSWSSPIAHALRGASVGDVRRVDLPGGTKDYEVLTISYPAGPSEG
jgi:transcription elongation factor GreB